MIVDLVKYKGHSCFRNDWAGFDAIRQVNLIIGRNNTGKSHMIDFVRVLCGDQIYTQKWQAYCAGILDELSLRDAFPENRSGGHLGSSHWSEHGARFVNRRIEWQVSENLKVLNLVFPDELRVVRQETQLAVETRLLDLARHAQSPLRGRRFRHLLADRDIRRERAVNELQLNEDGSGATNIVRRYLTSSTYPHDVINVELRTALNEIYRSDGSFTEIETKVHDSNTDNYWEIFLAEEPKGLVSLSRSGSGLKTVILVLLNLLVIPHLENQPKSAYVFAFEELENNLHPSLLRRLLRYIDSYATKEKATFFLTTHSSAALDMFGASDHAQIIHVRHDGISATAQTITTHFDRCGILSELGAKPSDLLQANGVLWLEGPSDRIYLNRFIELFSDDSLQEGTHYQCAFYGGSVLANSQFTEPEAENAELANLLRLNANIALVCDGDRTADTVTGSELKDRVARVFTEIAKVPHAFVWITEAKEVENYIPGAVWAKVYQLDLARDPGKFDRFPSKNVGEGTFVKDVVNRSTFDKVEFAMEAVPLLTKELLQMRFDLVQKITELVKTIQHWNR